MALATSTIMISRNLSFSARTLATVCAARPAPLLAGGVPARRLAEQAGSCGSVGPCCRPPVPDVDVCPPPPGPCRPCCNGGPCALCAPPCPCPPTNRPCGPHCIKAQGQKPCSPPKSPAKRISTTVTTAAGAGGVELVRRSVSCSQVASLLRRHLSTLPALRAASVTLIQSRRNSSKPHDAGCPCPAPCGPCGCPKGCGCLPPPGNLPPKCIQYMTGYYYYPYGTWFAGPYHVQGICQPVGKDSLSCDERGKAAPPPCPPKDCKGSSNSLQEYCQGIKKQCTPAKAVCPKPPKSCCPPKQQASCPPKPPACPPKPPACPPKPPKPWGSPKQRASCPPAKPPACPPKPACPPTKPAGPPKTCQARPAVPLTCFRSSEPRVCSPPKPTVTCPTPKQKVTCPSPKAKSLSEICKSTKKPYPPSPPKPARSCSPPAPATKSSSSICSTRRTSVQFAPRAATSKSCAEICSSRKQPAQTCPPIVQYQPIPTKDDKMLKSIFDFYLKSPEKPNTKPTRV